MDKAPINDFPAHDTKTTDDVSAVQAFRECTFSFLIGFYLLVK